MVDTRFLKSASASKTDTFVSPMLDVARILTDLFLSLILEEQHDWEVRGSYIPMLAYSSARLRPGEIKDIAPLYMLIKSVPQQSARRILR
jgi:hypothetical protein